MGVHDGGCEYWLTSGIRDLPIYLPLCQILDVDIDLASGDPFGRIRDATLKIRSPTFGGKIIWMDREYCLDAEAMLDVFAQDYPRINSSICYLSADQVLPNEHPVVVLLLLSYGKTDEGSRFVYALVLEPCGTTEDTMRRIGICQLEVKDGVDLAEHYGSTLIERTLLLK